VREQPASCAYDIFAAGCLNGGAAAASRFGWQKARDACGKIPMWRGSADGGQTRSAGKSVTARTPMRADPKKKGASSRSLLGKILERLALLFALTLHGFAIDILPKRFGE
jgi:hypothetical protein